MITYGYFALLGLSCVLALSDWRRAVYAAILLDFLRDPVRKLDSSESVLITISLLALWGVITIGAWNQSQGQIRLFLRSNPRIFNAFRLLVFATIPGCLMSLLLYSQGYKLVALGTISYLAPSAGVLLGALYASHPQQITKLLRFYCIINGLALLGVIAEYAEMGFPALGGLRGMNWIRYSGTETVDLIGGFYRSPDIMGLHAAQVVMFALILSSRKRRGLSLGWLVLAAFGSLCLLLAGRRKMLGMPIVFVAAFGMFCYLRRMRGSQFAALPIASVLIAAVGLYLVTTEDYVADEYTNYAATLFTQGVSRSRELVGGSVVSTLNQTGLLGTGIGSATQGNYHVGATAKGWQEDGLSRLFRELGLPGVVLVTLSGVALLRGTLASVRRMSVRDGASYLQLMLLAVVVANLASFTISHQQYSGDPPSALFVLLLLGMSLSLRPASVRAGRSIASPVPPPEHRHPIRR